LKILRTTSENPNFKELVKLLDEYLAIVDGDDHTFYDQFNKIDALQHCIVLFEDENPVGCGALKGYDEESAEIKRMFVRPVSRGKGYASAILNELENWARELSYDSVILETGTKQREAIKLYEKTYERIENYGQYRDVQTSVCFNKILKNK